MKKETKAQQKVHKVMHEYKLGTLHSGSKKGRLRVVVFQDVDFALRRTQSFCVGRQG